ncbi:hypothetical protein R52603_05540 [Paraburkholderia saeva]|jgi:hypothetical protein|nr:hypothetical protein R52603_05540 [Paraburkholderia saeva]
MVIKKRSRPKLVWLVFLYYLVRITVGAGGLLLVLHTASVSPHARAAVEGLTSLGWVLTGLILALRLSGAFALFALRRSALPLFVAGMCLSIVHALTHLTSFLTQPSRSSSLTLVIGWTINLSVCLYVYSLRYRSVLT